MLTGPLDVNCYIVTSDGEAMVIDPGGEPEKIYEIIKEKKLNLKRIVLTHGHFDHIGGADRLRRMSGARIYIHKEDAPMLSDDTKNLSFLTGEPPKHFSPDAFLDEGDCFNIGSAEFTVYHTPGHSGGGICLFAENVLFTGDLIFRGSIGRFDYGDFRAERASVNRMMHIFKDDVKILPGHGEETTVGYEKMYNPYVSRLDC